MGITQIDQHVINKVREKRKAANISQAALAHMLDVSEGFIGNIESTKYNDKYSVAHLNELAKIFKCSPKDFLPDEPF